MLRLKRCIVKLIIAVIFLLSFSAAGSEICANIMDYARLPLPSALLNATNLTTGKSFVTLSDKEGTACFSSIPEGPYSIEASLAGFLHVRYYPVRAVSSSKQKLLFSLPFAEISEGGVGDESTLSGTLLKGGSPVELAEVCMVGAAGAPKTCTVTNELGEYALVGPAGVYRTEVRTRDGKLHKSKVDISTPGIYRNSLSLDNNTDKR